MISERIRHTAIVALLTQFPFMQRALALGSKPWHRSKVMLVGEGRVGKTALCNSMMGKRFEETESTVGLTQLTCDVRRATAGNKGRWTEHTKPEAGLAQLMRNIETLDREAKESPSDQMSEVGSQPPCDVPAFVSGTSHQEQSQGKRDPATAHETKSRGGTIDGVDGSVQSIQPDVTLLIKCLADFKTNESDLILSFFDFGGQSVFNIIHHLFLTSYGVYVVVLSMVDVLDDDKRNRSLSEMSFWMNSIAKHTRDAMTRKIAPVFLVEQ